MRIRTSIALGILFSLASLASPPLLQAATFSPAAGQEEVPLVEGKAGSGVIRFSASGVSERIVRGRRGAMLSIPIEVDNRSHKDLLVNTLDIWVVTPDGTVLSQPELRQNGVAVWRAEVNARKRSQLVALFRLGSAAAFDSFELHWGGLLAYRPRTGVVSYAAAPGGGYVPQAAAPSSAGSGSGGGVDDQFAYEDLDGADPYWTLDDPDDWNEPYYGLSFGFVFGYPWYSYGYYPYYGYPGYGYGFYPPYYPGYPCSGCSGSSGRQVKEDAILRQAGSSPVRDSGRGRLVDTATARSRGRASGEHGRVITTTSRSSSGRVTGSRTSSRRSSVGRATTYRGSRGSVGRSSVGRSGGGRSSGARSGGGRSSGGRAGGGRSGGGRAGGGSRSSGRGRGR